MLRLFKQSDGNICCISFEVPDSLLQGSDTPISNTQTMRNKQKVRAAHILLDVIKAAKADNVAHKNHYSAKYQPPTYQTCIYQDFKQTPTHLNRVNLDPDKPRGILVVDIGDKTNTEHNAINRRITRITDNVLVPKNVLKVILPHKPNLKRHKLGRTTLIRTAKNSINFLCITVDEGIKKKHH